MKISIHRGLSELKLLNLRIDKSINALEPIGRYKLSQDKIIGTTDNKKEFEERAKSTYDSIKDLIIRRDKIKRVIVLSNAMTKVMISGTEYTVAEAIEKKESIEFTKSLLDKLKSQKRVITNAFTSEMENMEYNLEEQIKIISGNAKEQNVEYIKAFSEGYKKRNGYEIVDPLEIDKEIEKLEKYVDDFESEVDAVLSEINATTFIEI
ncbi:hypothetical protein AN639_07285 [Candidatus Epulonipiscium fishelsonii]|uniref:Uncharacterized protein n=1 Tax=Candidatus Epulonipiscium fishelsonii TaxID=77094 RepID=A0ACC8X9X8_9FIRM|nr:hypothetical protein AN639_07285 [Epulopiscium sp. SCG-B05WGA-EpuloA1]ONI39052.1 hypothetical protein AN396_09265 [Epulopiscium sp. SCG-B11WGA-EpuloA1]